jgi:methylated-DNA-[protein]-cysteine S-methyltransferase
MKSKTDRAGEIRNTAIGWVGVEVRGGYLHRVSLGGDSRAKAAGAIRPSEDSEAVNTVFRAIEAYSAGEGDLSLPLPIDWSRFTDFQSQVYRRLIAVDAGCTISYGELACEIARPGAARAVGSAMAANPIPLFIPCHRVLPSSGKVGAYSGADGPRFKKFLLDLESAHR